MSTPFLQSDSSENRETNLRLSHRFDEVGFSEIVKIRNRVMELKAEGKEIFQFEGGEPCLNTPDHVKQAAIKALDENKTRYAPSSGIPPLIQSIVKKLQKQNHIMAESNHVLVENGGMQGLYGAFNSVLDPGDEVLLFSPHWTPTRDLIHMSGGKAVCVNTIEARHRGIKSCLENHRTTATRVILLNTPQNPTGIVFTRDEIQEVADFAQQHDLIVIADEAYEDLVYTGEHISIASLPGMFERTISVYTLSKSYAMTGWRIGYAVAPEPFITGLQKSTLYSSNGVSTPTQWAALAALKEPSDFKEIALEGYRLRRSLLVDGLNLLGLKCDPPPAGAFYAFPEISKLGTSSSQVARQLLDEAHIATVPGIVFGAEGEGHLRFSFSVAPELIERGLEALSTYMRNLT
ncbi:MAG: pyridoxal phosphate-dependent aminotransferase [Blastocatellia bacterium]|nr:pyridoxal phosphate-dependent aminotransferase [Blastocatellia bacterium]